MGSAMTALLFALSVGSTPAAAQDSLPDAALPQPEATPVSTATPPTPAPTLTAAAPTGGPGRVALVVGGVASAVAGAAWFLEFGDRLGSGDHAAMLLGGGAIAAGGALAGALAVATVDGDGANIDDRAFAPSVAVTLGSGGTSTLGESAPIPGSVALTPRLQLSDRLRLTPRAVGHLDLGSTVHVDPRPQLDAPPGLTTRSSGIDLEIELRGTLGPDAARPTFDWILRPGWSNRWESRIYADDSERDLRRARVLPATVGGRWHLSGRQRFEMLVGPALTNVGWSEGGGRDATPVILGRTYFEATYQVGFDHAGPVLGHHATSRLRGRYVHSTYDGVGYNVGAVIGYFGPFEVAYDVRLRRRPSAWALQGGLGMAIGDGGGVAATVGLVPPVRTP